MASPIDVERLASEGATTAEVSEMTRNGYIFGRKYNRARAMRVEQGNGLQVRMTFSTRIPSLLVRRGHAMLIAP